MNTIKSICKILTLWAVLMVASGPGQPVVAQDAPMLISYQGYLTDDAHDPITGTTSLTFTIYDAGGVSKWSGTYPAVEVIDGLFLVVIGHPTGLPTEIFDGSDRYLGISVDGDDEILPRTLLTSVPGAAVSRRVVGDIRTAPGLVLVESAAGDSAVVLTAETDMHAVRIHPPDPCVPPDPCEPAIEMVAEPDNNIIRVHPPEPCVPPEPCGPAFEIAAAPSSNSMNLYTPGSSIPAFTVRASGAEDDYALLTLDQPPPAGTTFLGWRVESFASSETVTMTAGSPLGDNKHSVVMTSSPSAATVIVQGEDLLGDPPQVAIVAGPEGARIGIGTDSPAEALEVVGNAHVEGNLTWQEKTSYVAISAAAFGPADHGTEYLNFGQSVALTGGGPSGFFHAQVQLPQGAEVDRMTCYWEDNITENGEFSLRRLHLIDGSADVMGLAETSGDGGNGSSYDDSIEYGLVDNAENAYFIRARLYSDMALYGIVIEYRFTEPY